MQRRVLIGRNGRRVAVLLLVLGLAGIAGGVQQASARKAAQDPIVVGQHAVADRRFAATGIIHKVAGEEYVERLNANGGLLGRPVEWKLLDDESDQAKVTTLYEQLISQDRVDLIMGPYATPNILAAQAVAERHGYVCRSTRRCSRPALTYECQFPAWSTGASRTSTSRDRCSTALATPPHPPKRIAIVTNQSGSTDFVANGVAELERGRRGEVGEEARLQGRRGHPLPADDHRLGPIAAQVRDANPDLVFNNGLGVDAVEPHPGDGAARLPAAADVQPVPGARAAARRSVTPAQGVLSISLFEPNGGSSAAGQEARPSSRVRPRRRGEGSVHACSTQATASWTRLGDPHRRRRGAPAASTTRRSATPCRHGAKTTFVGQAHVQPGRQQLLAARTAAQADPGRRVGRRLAADRARRSSPGPRRLETRPGSGAPRRAPSRGGGPVAGVEADTPDRPGRLTGALIGGLYAVMAIGLSLTWGMLRVINLAHFGLILVGAYLTFELATSGIDPILTCSSPALAVRRSGADAVGSTASASPSSTRCWSASGC